MHRVQSGFSINTSESDVSDRLIGDPTRPMIRDFCAYLPWACHQAGISKDIIINTIVKSEIKKKPRSPGASVSQTPLKSEQELPKSVVVTNVDPTLPATPALFISAVLIGNHITQLIFEKSTEKLSQDVLKIIALLVVYQPSLTSIVIRSKYDAYTPLELKNVLNYSNITEVNFDDTFLPEANYDVLLTEQNNLRHLSLSRCQIEDFVVQNIAAKLKYPMIASERLTTLSLSCNRITDIGAFALADALRTNRKLVYINLAGNMITNDGAKAILHTLHKFELPPEDCELLMNTRILYFNKKRQLITKMLREQTEGQYLQIHQKRKSSSDRKRRSVSNVSELFCKKIEKLAKERVGDLEYHPFCTDAVYVDGKYYNTRGNNVLAYLNLSYNQLHYSILKTVLEVLIDQQTIERENMLTKVLLEGNPLPIECDELEMIDALAHADLKKRVPNFKTSIAKPPANQPRKPIKI